eukprot:2679338-Karenia_brevis.AAC.1
MRRVLRGSTVYLDRMPDLGSQHRRGDGLSRQHVPVHHKEGQHEESHHKSFVPWEEGVPQHRAPAELRVIAEGSGSS